MKRLYLFLLVALLSCENYLDKGPLDTLTNEQAFATEGNLQLYVNSFYGALPSAQAVYGTTGVLENYYFIGDIMSDVNAWTQNITYLTGGFTSQNSQGWDWTELRNVNYFLANYYKANTTVERKNHFAGIARFFRANFYFEKVKLFGDVPWYSTPQSPTDDALFKSRDSRELVMDSILADVSFAVQHIMDVKDNSATMITKSAALALKSRICLFEGTFRKYHDELGLVSSANSWLEEAVSAAGELIQSGAYSLVNTGNAASDYRSLFTSTIPPSNEIILARVFSDNLRIWHNATDVYSNTGAYQTSLTRRFINTYLNADGTRFTDQPGYNQVEFAEEMSNRDLRLSQTIRTPSYRRADGSVEPPYLGQARTGYHILKFSLDDRRYDNLGQSNNAIPLIRYAEVLLNYAEAKAELGTLSDADWTITIGALRQRAGIESTAMPTTLDPYMKENFYPAVNSIAVMEIRRERAIELAVEGFRYADLRRWKAGDLLEKSKDGIYVKAMNEPIDLNEDGQTDVIFVATVPAEPQPRVYYYVVDNSVVKLSDGTSGNVIWQANMKFQYPDFKYYMPLPFGELVLNNNLMQNIGWDHP